jgi:hypothetical protein
MNKKAKKNVQISTFFKTGIILMRRRKYKYMTTIMLNNPKILFMKSRRLSCPGSYVVRGCPEPNLPCTVMVRGVVLGFFTILFRPKFLDWPVECLGDFYFYLDNFSVVILRLRCDGISDKLPRYATVSRNVRIPNIFFKEFDPDF